MSILIAENVIKQYKQYDEVVTAVNRVSIKIEDGEFIAIIGASGSGKSTFLNLCAGLDRPNSGSIKIRGNDITQMKPDELSRFRGNFPLVLFRSLPFLATVPTKRPEEPVWYPKQQKSAPTVVSVQQSAMYRPSAKKIQKRWTRRHASPVCAASLYVRRVLAR